MTTFNLNLHEMVYSLSDALDLVGVVQIHHGKRVGFMAAECGKQLGLEAADLDNLFQAAILHDCGVSNTSVHSRLAQFEWEQVHGHCEIGAALLRMTPPLAHLSDVILHHHTHWTKLQTLDLPEQTALQANLIFLVDRVDVLSLHSQVNNANILLGIDEIIARIVDKSGDWFKPELVDAFVEIASSEAFWLSLEREHVDGYVGEWINHESTRSIAFEDVKSLVRIFSHIVDAKSPFTHEHSEGVASLARYLGEQFDLSPKSCDMLDLAGLLHDIGKLRVPDDVLEKPGRLSNLEFKTIQRHSFDTFSILKRVQGFDDIARWAGQHHERVDGGGYPYRTKDSKLSLEARIIAVADIFQALAQDRPYRPAMTPEQVLEILAAESAAGKLDHSVVSMIENNLGACWKKATLKQASEKHDSVIAEQA
ncbi:cyclic di-GMP phosphodiesterase response regulator RpfG [Mariprofundus micogutta]|uniref:Cyclic di-GMP phosphodiesterase response regulator RpfG n=1 Tax=Mariprofundus micogutta TaxID=1921010 RepID=A0A1L8CMN3_9PROT|nr:HD domain-containing phosphohydrolase [Mariprofundus micogutta]GAV20164.1 cyclic di-GMP phosphodiesterase response regulator RpfG [Mariprofundus micogutta]